MRTRRQQPNPVKERVRRHVERIKHVTRLYEPFHRAVDGELSRSASGRRLLTDRRRLIEQLKSRHPTTISPEVKKYREELRAAGHGALLAAAIKHARLLPSAEALISSFSDDDRRVEQVWTVQLLFSQAILIAPKETDDVAVTRQGLDSDPPDVAVCIQPPYLRQDRKSWSFSWGWGYPSTTATTGLTNVYVGASSVGTAGGAHALVGSDFDIPIGVVQCEAYADVDFEYDVAGWAILGAAAAGSEIVIRVEGDGVPATEIYRTLFTLVAPGIWGAGARQSGSARISMPFIRTGSRAGKVRVTVGSSGHAECGGLVGNIVNSTSVTVNEICVRVTA